MRRRVNIRAILLDPRLRRELMVGAIRAIQNREGIPTTVEQAERAYDKSWLSSKIKAKVR